MRQQGGVRPPCWPYRGERRGEFEVLLVDPHVLAEGNRGCLGASDQVHPASALAGGVAFLDDRLVMLEGVHLGEIVVAHDLGEADSRSNMTTSPITRYGQGSAVVDPVIEVFSCSALPTPAAATG